MRDPYKTEVAVKFAALIQHADERFVASRIAFERDEYRRLGLTDSVLLAMATSGGTILTADAPLYIAAVAAGLPAINYNHVRERRPDYQ